jgi:hypothetical protein
MIITLLKCLGQYFFLFDTMKPVGTDGRGSGCRSGDNTEMPARGGSEVRQDIIPSTHVQRFFLHPAPVG